MSSETLPKLELSSSLFLSATLHAQNCDLPAEKGLKKIFTAKHQISAHPLQNNGYFYIGWNQHGLAMAVPLLRKMVNSLVLDTKLWSKKQTPKHLINLMIDTRNNQNVSIPTRYCHHFGIDREDSRWRVTDATRLRQTEQRPPVNVESIIVDHWSEESRLYCGVWLPAAALYGYDPTALDHLGFSWYTSGEGCSSAAVRDEFGYMLQDVEFLPKIAQTPALWSTLILEK